MADETDLATTPANTAPGYSGTNIYFVPSDSDAELQRKADVLLQEAVDRVLQEAQDQGLVYYDPLSLAQAVEAKLTLKPVGPPTPQFIGRIRAAIRTVLSAKQEDLFLKAVELGTAHAILVTEGESAVQRPLIGADPVVLFNGQFSYSVDDLRVRGAGIDFVFVRTYKNQAVYRSSLGHKWDHSYNLWLRVSPDQRTISCSTGALREDRYVWHDTFDYWVPPDGQDGVFTQSSGSFVWRAPDGRRHFYEPDPSNLPLVYRIARIEDRFDNSLTFVYIDGRLRRVEINHPRRFVDFTYDEAGRLIRLTDHVARLWSYRYDNHDDLIAVTTPATDPYPNGLTTSYEYSSMFSPVELQHNLVRIIDAAGQVYLENEYGTDSLLLSFNRVTCQRQGGGETRFEYADVVQVFDVDYVEHERPTHETVIVERNGHVRRHVFNRTGNLLLREERVLLEGLPATLRWHYRYNRDGNLIATLTPEGTLTQYLFGRDLFMRRHPEIDEAALSAATAVTMEERQGFGRLLAIVRRRHSFILSDLNLVRGVWGDMFPDVFRTDRQVDETGELVADDIIVKFDYEPTYGQVRSISDPRYTNSADPSALDEHTLHASTLTRYDHAGPPADPTRFVVAIVHPAPTFPDGTRGPQIVERFTHPDATPAYDSRGRLLRHVNATGTVVEYTYVAESLNEARSGHLQRTVVDPGDLAISTEQEVDELGRVVITRLPRFVTVSDERFRMRTIYNELDQVVETITTAPFSFSTRRFYDRCGMLEREERQAIDDRGAPVQGGIEIRTFTYDAELNLTSESLGGRDPMSQLVTRYCIGASGERLATILPTGARIWQQYDERLLQVAVTMGACSPDAATWRTLYDGDGRPRRRIDARGNVTRLRYDAFGHVVTEEDPDGHVTLISYDKAGNVICVRGFELREDGYYLLARTETNYDEVNRPIRAGTNRFDEPLGPVLAAQLEEAFRTSPGPGELLVTQTFYDARGRAARRLDPMLREQTFSYDAVDRLVAETDALGNQILRSYDLHNNLVRRDLIDLVRDPGDNTTVVGQRVFSTSVVYDELDRVVTSTDSLGNTTRYAYDSRGNQLQEVDPLGNVRRADFDIFNRRIAIHQELTDTGLGAGVLVDTATTRYGYDGNGNVTTVVDALGRQTEYLYDALNRQRVILYPDGSQVALSYDPDGNVILIREVNGLQRRITVDALGRTTRVDADTSQLLAGVVVEGATFEEYSYDALGRCIAAVNDFARCETQVNSLGWPIAEKLTYTVPLEMTPLELVLRRSFDRLGAVTRLTYPNGRRIRLDRDSLGRLTEIHNESNGTEYPGSAETVEAYLIAALSYRGRHRGSVRYAHGGLVRYAHDGAGRVIEIDHSSAAGALLRIQYLHDGASNVRVRNHLSPVRDGAEVFSYDSLHRLTQVTEQLRPPFNSLAFAPLTAIPPEPIPLRQALINAVIGPLAQAPKPANYQYDLVGNREREEPSDRIPVDYVVNELDQITSRNGTAFTSDPNGNLQDDAQRRYIYDSVNRLVRVTDVNEQDLARFFHDARGRRILEVAEGTVTQLVWDDDHLIAEYRDGVPFALYVNDDAVDRPFQIAADGVEHWYHSDLVGSVRLLTDAAGTAVRYDYSPFGEPLAKDDSVYNPLRFTGRRWDRVLESYDYRARQYDPRLGRFLQRDPSGMINGTNLYIYTRNNPLPLVDPFGTDARVEQDKYVFVRTQSGIEIFNNDLTPWGTQRDFLKQMGFEVIDIPLRLGSVEAMGDMVNVFSDQAAATSAVESGGSQLKYLAGEFILGAIPPSTYKYAIKAHYYAEHYDVRGRTGAAALHHFNNRIAARWGYASRYIDYYAGAAAGVAGLPAEAASAVGPGLVRMAQGTTRVMRGTRRTFPGTASIARRTVRAGINVVGQVDPSQLFLRFRDEAVDLTRRLAADLAARGFPMRATEFGTHVDAIFKAHVMHAIDEGVLPATFQVTRRGRYGVDVWDQATGLGWDITTAKVREVVGHDVRYIGETMPDGTTIVDVIPLVYTR
jgi:RHS repeat-associated protein